MKVSDKENAKMPYPFKKFNPMQIFFTNFFRVIMKKKKTSPRLKENQKRCLAKGCCGLVKSTD